MKYWWIIGLVLIWGCGQRPSELGEKIKMQEAELFFLKKVNQDTLLCIIDGKDTLSFSKKDKARFHFLSTTWVGYLDVLQSTECLKGLVCPETVTSTNVQTQLRNGTTFNLQQSGNTLDPEQFFLHPADYICYSPFDPAPEKIPQNSIAIPVCDYLEKNAWARLEWVKVFGFLTNRYPQACSYFNEVIKGKKMYQFKNPQSILIGSHDGQNFYWSSKNSAVNQLASDAGFQVLGTPQLGNAILEKEELYVQMKKKPIVLLLITQAQQKSMQDMVNTWRQQYGVEVYSILVDTTAYFEISIIHPDWLLQDFIDLGQQKKLGHFIQAMP